MGHRRNAFGGHGNGPPVDLAAARAARAAAAGSGSGFQALLLSNGHLGLMFKSGNLQTVAEVSAGDVDGIIAVLQRARAAMREQRIIVPGAGAATEVASFDVEPTADEPPEPMPPEGIVQHDTNGGGAGEPFGGHER